MKKYERIDNAVSYAVKIKTDKDYKIVKINKLPCKINYRKYSNIIQLSV